MEDLRVRLSLDSSQFDSGVNSAGNSLGTLKGKMSEVGEGLKLVGTTMTAIGSGMVAAVTGIVAKGSEWSASVESTQFLYNNLDKAVQNSIKTNQANAKALGMTEQQYKNNATTIATYYKNMGLTGEEAAKLSEKSMNLTADLAAVADVPVDEALRDVKSALMGNYEAVDKYGVSLSASSLENSEYVKSLGKKWNQLSDNEKMMAAYNEITRQSASAQGLAKQEANSFGMQMKLLKESIGEAVGKLGTTLLPVLEPIAKKFQEVTEKAAKWVEENPKLAQAILLVVGGLGLFLAVVGPIVAAIGMITLGMTALSAVSFPVVAAVIGITVAVAALVAAGIWLYANWETVKAKSIEIWNAIKQAVSTAMSATGEFLTSAWESTKAFLISCWEGIKSFAVSIWEGIKSAISTAVNTIKTIITTIWSAIVTIITTILNAILSVVSAIWNTIKTIITTYVNYIKTVITTAFNVIRTIITTVLNVVNSIVSSVWSSIKSVFTNSCNAVKSTVSNAFNGLKGTVSNALNGVLDTAKSIWNKVTGIFKNPISAVVNVFKKESKAIPSTQAGTFAARAFSYGYSAAEAMSAYSRADARGINNSNNSLDSSNMSQNMTVNVVLDSKVIATQTAPYLDGELNILSKRKNRLGGALV